MARTRHACLWVALEPPHDEMPCAAFRSPVAPVPRPRTRNDGSRRFGAVLAAALLTAIALSGVINPVIAKEPLLARERQNTSPPEDAASLWSRYRKLGAADPNLPDCSLAGYRYGRQDRPEPRLVFNVRNFGASGDGRIDDTAAVLGALGRAKGEPCVLYFPDGIYRISGVIRIAHSGVVLRGESTQKTVLFLDRSLTDIRGPDDRWSFRGGLIWVEPAPQWNEAVERPVAVRLIGPAEEGETRIRIPKAAAGILRKSIGKPVRLTWDGDTSLANHILGYEPSATGFWNNWSFVVDGRLHWEWHNEMVAVGPDWIRLRKPLRLPIRGVWRVLLYPDHRTIQDVGIERLTIRGAEHPRPKHLQEPGFNAIFFMNAMHCWVRDVQLEGLDNGIILERSTNNTIERFTVREDCYHHATSCRYASHDNVFSDFNIQASVMHGLSTQDLSSGNVWHRGHMNHGILDCHRGMPFDSIRSNITIVSCDGRSGGSNDAGPYVGRRMVTWNVLLAGHRGGSAEHALLSPRTYPRGALVGIRGSAIIPDGDIGPGMPPGEKSCLVLNPNQTAEPADLYQAQKTHQQKTAPRP